MRATLAALTIAAGIASLPAQADCPFADIQIKQGTWERHGQDIRITGEFRNACPIALMVELRATFRDAAGSVIRSKLFLPAGARDISPGERVPFENLIEDDIRITSMEITVFEAKP